MWTCQACMRRGLQALAWDATVSSPLSHFRPSITTSPRRRAFQASAVLNDTAEGEYRKPREPPVSAVGVPSTARNANRQEWLDSRGVRPANKPAKKDADLDFVVRRHLKYLQDPLKLAEHVRRSLREGDIDTTLEVVRAASKSIQCTVSWNHLIEWYLQQGKMKLALRTYNEMKKRSQTPDSRTFTIIFNGAASLSSAPEHLGKVLSLYHSMFSDRTPVRPNIIHVNALLKMCARANNIDAMLAIVENLPPTGSRTPNNLTYTTIINAIRRHAVLDLRTDLTPIQKRANIREGMLDGRRIWQDISQRWWRGDFWIDEELVCAIGRLFLIGEEQDQDDVMSLVEQAMNIPRQTPRMSTKRETIWHRPRSQENPDTSKLGISDATLGQDEVNAMEIEKDTITIGSQGHGAVPPAREVGGTETDLEAAFLDQLRPARPDVSSQIPSGEYAKPGCNTLSLLLESTLHLRQKEAATKYWELLTKDYGVQPDLDNYHCYLRVLRMARASSDAVRLLHEMPQSFLYHKTFRIAMSACGRDRRNPNVFTNAGKILDLMQGSDRMADVATMTTYLEVAMSAAPVEKIPSKDPQALKLAKGRQIIQALDRLQPPFVNIDFILERGLSSGSDDEARKQHFDKVITLIRTMISAHHVLVDQKLVPESWEKNHQNQRAKLTALAARYRTMESTPNPINAARNGKGRVRKIQKRE